MKKQMGSAIALLAFSLVSHAASQSALDGQWTLMDRVCTDGQSAQDRFQIGRDTIEITITGNQLQTRQVIENKVYADTGLLTMKGRQLEIQQDHDGVVTRAVFTLSLNKNELILFTFGFGKGGSCAEGAGLLTILQRR